MKPTFIRDIHYSTKCTDIYSLVSYSLGVPSHMLTLSNGVQILRRNKQLSDYVVAPVNPSHGITLQCYVKHLGGDSGDEFGE